MVEICEGRTAEKRYTTSHITHEMLPGKNHRTKVYELFVACMVVSSSGNYYLYWFTISCSLSLSLSESLRFSGDRSTKMCVFHGASSTLTRYYTPPSLSPPLVYTLCLLHHKENTNQYWICLPQVVKRKLKTTYQVRFLFLIHFWGICVQYLFVSCVSVGDRKDTNSL